LQRLAEHGVKILTRTRPERITDESVTVVDHRLRTQIIKADNVVLACGMTTNKELAEALKKNEVANIYVIGDCVEPRRIFEAIQEAFEIIFKI